MSQVLRAKDFRYNDKRKIKREVEGGNVMNEQRKRLIKEALGYEIIDVITFIGYKGDELIEISTMQENSKTAIETIARHLGFSVEVKKDDIEVIRLYCASKSNAYDLKYDCQEDVYGFKEELRYYDLK